MTQFTLNFSIYGESLDEILESAKAKVFAMTSEVFDFSMQSQYEIYVSENSDVESRIFKTEGLSTEDSGVYIPPLKAELIVRVKHA